MYKYKNEWKTKIIDEIFYCYFMLLRAPSQQNMV